jgi:hypothetical protein
MTHPAGPGPGPTAPPAPRPPRSSSWSGRYRPYWLQPPPPGLPAPPPPPAPASSSRRTLVLVVAGVLAAASLLVGGGAAGMLLGRRGDLEAAAAAPAPGTGPGIAPPAFTVTLPSGWTDRTEWTVPMRQDAYLRTDKVWEGKGSTTQEAQATVISMILGTGDPGPMESVTDEVAELKGRRTYHDVQGPKPATVAGEQAAMFDRRMTIGGDTTVYRTIRVHHDNRSYSISLNVPQADFPGASRGLDQILSSWRWV